MANTRQKSVVWISSLPFLIQATAQRLKSNDSPKKFYVYAYFLPRKRAQGLVLFSFLFDDIIPEIQSPFRVSGSFLSNQKSLNLA